MSLHEKDVYEEKEQNASIHVAEAEASEGSRFQRFYRSAFFQILVVSVLAFTGPAQADTISGLGGGGQATPWTVNAALSASYSAVAFISLIGGPLASRMGIKLMLIIGAATFPINGSAYYVNSKYGVQWYLIFGRFLYGIGFGLWYVAEAAIILSYPEEGRRGHYLAIWVMSRNLGQVVGGSITLARNAKAAAAGAIATSTYLIFIGIECLGFPASFLLSSPDKVRRSDGTEIKMTPKAPLKEEMKLLWEAIIHPRTLLLTPFFAWSYFYGSVMGTYLTLYFSVRARALSSLIVPITIIVFTALFGLVLDIQRLSQRRRAQIGFALVAIPSTICLSWLCWCQKTLLDEPLKMDWSHPKFLTYYMPFLGVQVVGYLCQTYIYWLISCFSTSVQGSARNGGVFRSIEAIGQAVSYAINSRSGNRWVPMGINFGLGLLAIPFTLWVVQSVPLYREDAKNAPSVVQHKEGEEERP